MKRLLLLLLLCAPVAVHAAPASVPLAISPDEIALAGEVQSVNSGRGEFSLLADSFRLPSGKTGHITPPKTKLVRVKNGSTPRVGAKIEVAGKDEGSERPLQAREVRTQDEAALAPAPATLVQAAGISEARPAPVEFKTFPMEETRGGWTFRVNSASWTTTQQYTGTSVFACKPTFSVTAGASPADGSQGVLADLHTRLLSPAGAPIARDEVDPDWPFVWVELTGRTGTANNETQTQSQLADGEREEAVAFELAPLHKGETRALKMVGKTQSGVRVELREVAMPDDKELRVKYHFDSPAALPDARVSSTTFHDVQLGGGDNQRADSRGGWGEGSWGGDLTRSCNFDQMPAGDKWKLWLNFSIVQRALATDDRVGVRLKVPIPKVTPSGLAPDEPVVEAKNADVIVRVATDGMFGLMGWNGDLGVRDAAGRRGQTWKISKAFATLPGQAPEEVWPQEEPHFTFFHRDGSRAAPGEMRIPVDVSLDPDKRPAKFDLKLELQASRLFDSSFAVETALPAPGQALETDVDVTSDSGAPWTLKRVVSFSPDSPLPNLKFPAGIARVGLALVFEVEPTLPGGWMMPTLQWAHDDHLRPLNWSGGLEWQDGDVTRTDAPKGTFQTLFLSLPAANARHIWIGSLCRETQETGQKTTLEMQDIPVMASRIHP